MQKFLSVSELISFIESIPKFQTSGKDAMNYGLERIIDALEEIGNPHQKYEVIHVAGTNGKGAVCHMLASILHEAGHTVGLFTSPHLERYNERFRIDGVEIKDDELIEFFNDTIHIIQRHNLSYFEISTFVAFGLFAIKNIDIAVIETGLGGRLDATNVVNPIASVITSIGNDHADVLGNTIEKIAYEKAGIIKHKKTVFTGEICDEAFTVIQQVASQKQAPLYSLSTSKFYLEDANLVGSSPAYGNFKIKFDEINPVMALNAQICANVIQLFPNVEFRAFKNGLTNFRHFTQYRGRMERLAPDKNWFYDGAHNTEALSWLYKTALNIKADKKVIVFTCMKDKITKEFAGIVSQFDEMFYFRLDNQRAATYGELCTLLPALKPLDLKSEIFFDSNAAIFFTGSFYFYGDIKYRLANMSF